MVKRRKAQRARGGHVPHISHGRLVSGWGAPAGTRVRLVTAADTSDVLRLMALAGTEVSDGTVSAMEEGRCSAGVVEMLQAQDHLLVLATRMHQMINARDGESQEGELTTILVAEDRTGEAVGALLALPPIHIVSSGVAQGADPDRMLLITASQIVKMCGLAVNESARDAGIGAALMRRAMQLYTQLGYQLMYGQIARGSGLESYYRRFGYETSPPGYGLSLECVGLPGVHVTASPAEQMIVYQPHWGQLS